MQFYLDALNNVLAEVCFVFEILRMQKLVFVVTLARDRKNVNFNIDLLIFRKV